MSSRVRRISTFLALQRGTLGVFAMVILVGIGERMGERFLPIYILALGGGAIVIGLLQAFAFGVVGTVVYALFGRDEERMALS